MKICKTSQMRVSLLPSMATLPLPAFAYFLHIAANCSDPGTPGNGYKEGSEFTGGKTVTFKCYKGYGIVGVKEITCNQETAKWSRETPKCEST